MRSPSGLCPRIISAVLSSKVIVMSSVGAMVIHGLPVFA